MIFMGGDKMATITMQEAKKRFNLYREGLTDKEIAKECDIAVSTVGAWRRRNGLTPNKNRQFKSYKGQLTAVNYKPKLCKKCDSKFSPKTSNQQYCPECQRKRPISIRPVNY